MLTARLGLHGLEDTFSRSIRVGIIQDIQKQLGFTSEVNFNLETDKESIDVERTGNAMTAKRSVRETDLNISVSEDYTNDYTTTSYTRSNLSIPFYIDTDLKSTFRPIYMNNTLRFSMEYSTKSKSQAYRITNKLRTMTNTNNTETRHDVTYSYILPHYLNLLLININALKNRRVRLPDRIGYERYVDNTFDKRLSTLLTHNLDYTKERLTIKEKQCDCLGQYTDDMLNIKPEYDEGTQYWKFSFEYIVYVSKPVEVLAIYPLMVYNNFINKKFRTVINKVGIRKQRPKIMSADTEISDIDYEDPMTVDEPWIRYPSFDNAMLTKLHKHNDTIFTALLQVDIRRDKDVMNITDIPTFDFKPEILAVLKTTEYKYITEQYNSIFNIVLYKDGLPDVNNKIVVDEDLNIVSTKSMDITSTYHIEFSLLKDLSLLHPMAMNRIKKMVGMIPGNIVGEVSKDTPDVIYTDTEGMEYYDKQHYMPILGNDLTNAYFSTVGIQSQYIDILREQGYDNSHLLFSLFDRIKQDVRRMQTAATQTHSISYNVAGLLIIRS